jgi:hypothetical protein
VRGKYILVAVDAAFPLGNTQGLLLPVDVCLLRGDVVDWQGQIVDVSRTTLYRQYERCPHSPLDGDSTQWPASSAIVQPLQALALGLGLPAAADPDPARNLEPAYIDIGASRDIDIDRAMPPGFQLFDVNNGVDVAPHRQFLDPSSDPWPAVDADVERETKECEVRSADRDSNSLPVPCFVLRCAAGVADSARVEGRLLQGPGGARQAPVRDRGRREHIGALTGGATSRLGELRLP